MKQLFGEWDELLPLDQDGLHWVACVQLTLDEGHVDYLNLRKYVQERASIPEFRERFENFWTSTDHVWRLRHGYVSGFASVCEQVLPAVIAGLKNYEQEQRLPLSQQKSLQAAQTV